MGRNSFIKEPEYFEAKALDKYANLTLDEVKVWGQHPCTLVLISALQGTAAGVIQQWLSGGYSSAESSDATAQLQAKARGMGQAAEDIIETIEDISTGQFGELLDGDTTSGT